MKRSVDRILTTHTGSLIRPPELLEFVVGVIESETGRAHGAARESRMSVELRFPD